MRKKSKLIRRVIILILGISTLPVLGLQNSLAAGSTWTSSTFPNSKTAFSILFANNLFVAAPWDQSETYVQTSTDGINWTQRSTPVSGGWESIAYGNGIYVAVGDVGGGLSSNKYIYSSDGVTWHASNTVTYGATRDVAFGNGIFVATQGGSCTNNCIRTSTDGITWTVRTTPTSGNFRSVLYTGSAFYATSNNGLGITSSDGLSWTSISGIGSNVEELAYGNSKIIAVSTNGVITYSSDFSTWTQGSNYSSSKNWQHVIYADDKFVAIAIDGTINISSDGINWSSVTSNLTSGGFLAFGLNKFVALSAGGNSFAYSVNPSTPPSAPTLTSVTSGDRSITVSFTAGADNGAAITDYEYSLNSGAYTSAGTTTSPFTITGLSGRTSYSVTIKARNSAGLSTASSSLSATTTDASRDASEAAAAKKAKEQKELTELLSIIPSIAGLALNLGDLTNSLLTTKCVKGKTIKYVKKGAKCPKGYVKKK